MIIGNMDNEISSAHGIVPTVWSDDGSLTVGNNESITLLKGLGLKLGPGQDAAKVTMRVGGITRVSICSSGEGSH